MWAYLPGLGARAGFLSTPTRQLSQPLVGTHASAGNHKVGEGSRAGAIALVFVSSEVTGVRGILCLPLPLAFDSFGGGLNYLIIPLS